MLLLLCDDARLPITWEFLSSGGSESPAGFGAVEGDTAPGYGMFMRWKK